VGNDRATDTDSGNESAASTEWAPYVMLIGLGTVAAIIANGIPTTLPLGCRSRWLSVVCLMLQLSPCKLLAETDHH